MSSSTFGLNSVQYVEPLYQSSPDFINLSADLKSSLITTYSTAELNNIFVSPDNPILSPPVANLNEFLGTLMTAINKFSQEIPKSTLNNIVTGTPINHLGNVLGQAYANYSSQVTVATEQVANTAFQTWLQLSATNSAAYAQTIAEQALIDNLNSNGSDTKISASLLKNTYYIAFFSEIQHFPIGATPNGDGTYSLPATITQEGIDLYNELAKAYALRVSAFNTGMDSRNILVNKYNAGTNSYNSNANINNGIVNEIIDKFQLTESIPLQPLAQVASEGPLLHSPLPTTNVVGSGKAIKVSIGTPPSWVTNLSNNGPPVIPALPAYNLLSPSELTDIQNDVYNKLYDQVVVPLNNATKGTLEVAQAYQALFANLPPLSAVSQNPLLNAKPLLQRILPVMYARPTTIFGGTSTQGADALSAFINGTQMVHSQAILSTEMLNLVYRAFKLDVAQKTIVQTHLQNMLDKFGNLSSLVALLPSLGVLAGQFGNIPVNSAALTVSFATSFLNRAQEIVVSKVIETGTKQIFTTSASFDDITVDDQNALAQNIAALLNTAFLLQATNLLAASLGSTTLLPAITKAVLPAESSKEAIRRAQQLNAQTYQLTSEQIKQNFVAQGYPVESAAFLGTVGADLVANGALAPQVATVEANGVNTSILLATVQAGLVLNGVNLGAASEIATLAVNQALQGQAEVGKAVSTPDFLAELEGNLRSLGQGPHAHEIALGAVILPAEKPENFVRERPEVFAGQRAEVFAGQRPEDFINVQRILNLIVPHLGVTVAQRVVGEVYLSLFGVADPTTAQKADVASPVSLINTLKQEVQKIQKLEDRNYADVMNRIYSDSISLSTQPVKFLHDLLDPAFLMAHSINNGMMYAGNEPSNWKKSIAIQV